MAAIKMPSDNEVRQIDKTKRNNTQIRGAEMETKIENDMTLKETLKEFVEVFIIDLSYKLIEELKKENPTLSLEIEKESKLGGRI